jgi:hypothetical protein
MRPIQVRLVAEDSAGLPAEGYGLLIRNWLAALSDSSPEQALMVVGGYLTRPGTDPDGKALPMRAYNLRVPEAHLTWLDTAANTYGVPRERLLRAIVRWGLQSAPPQPSQSAPSQSAPSQSGEPHE